VLSPVVVKIFFTTDQKEIAKTIDSIISQMITLKELLLGSVKEVESPPEAIEQAQKGLCLLCGRPLSDFKTRPSRGCHAQCYKQVMAKIKVGPLTEAEAIETGMLLKEKAGGRPPIVDIDAVIQSRKGHTAEEIHRIATEEAATRRKGKGK